MLARQQIAASVLCLVAGATYTHAQVVEVSKDGRERVELNPSIERPTSERGGPVPIDTIPDWEFNLRRQVGAVRVADMNNDGLNDIVIGCYTSQSFPPYDNWQDMIVYNTPSGLPASAGWVSADQIHTGDMQIGDINRDGFPDIFAVSGGSAFSAPRIYFGSASGPSASPGWFATPPTSGWATSGVLFDIDNDGDLDAVTTNQGVSPNPYRPMYFFRNNGTGLETSPSWQSAESSIQNTVAAGDYDGDGDLDIAVSKWVSFLSGIYRNNAGTLELTPAWTSGTDTNRGVAFADIDGDNDQDLAIGGSPSIVYKNNGGGAYAANTTLTPPFSGVQENTFADVDHDGDPDFAEVHFSNGAAHIYLNHGGVISSTPDWTYDATEVGNAIAFGDLNGDGWDDLVVGYSGNVCVRVFFAVPPPTCDGDTNNDGAVNSADLSVLLAQFGQSVTPGTGADFNNDGVVNAADLSVLLSNFGSSC